MRWERAGWLGSCAIAVVFAGCVEAHVLDCAMVDVDHPLCRASRDAGNADAGADAGATDGGAIDAGSVDGGTMDGGTADGGGDFCAGAVLCDTFDDGSLTSGLFVEGATDAAWTSRHFSWLETTALSEAVLTNGSERSTSWWGSTCSGTLEQTGPAILQSTGFSVGASAGFAIDFDYYQVNDACGDRVVGVGLTEGGSALTWSTAPPHFIGGVWFFALVGTGVELYDATATMIYNTGTVGYTPNGVWYHFHVEMCVDGRWSVRLSERDDPSTVYVNQSRITPNANIDLPRSVTDLGVFLVAEGTDKYIDDLRVVPGCTL